MRHYYFSNRVSLKCKCPRGRVRSLIINVRMPMYRPLVIKVVSGYLPSVILLLFFYTVPPMMMLFSTVEGPISHSGRKKSACCKVLYFTIWNVFFVNVLSGSVINQLNAISRPKDIPSQLAEAVPKQVLRFLPWWWTSWYHYISLHKTIFAFLPYGAYPEH